MVNINTSTRKRTTLSLPSLATVIGFIVVGSLLGVLSLLYSPLLPFDGTTKITRPIGNGSQRPTTLSHRTPMAYGTKSAKERTALLVTDAIRLGFRHIVTGGHHSSHNETAVGLGWKEAGIPRWDLFLETCFVPWSGNDFAKQPGDPPHPPTTIQEQVHLSIQTSLRNLQTHYIDAVMFHNFRAKLHPFEDMMEAWRVLETYVQKGIIRHLGMTSVHDAPYWERLYNESTVKPTLLQNRFHSNRGYDVDRQALFRSTTADLQLQRFWLLNGSSRQGAANEDMARRKGVTPQQLLLAFVLSLGNTTCLVGTQNLEHMRDDLEIAQCYPFIFDNNEERMEYARKLGFRPPSWEDYDSIGAGHGDFASCKAHLQLATIR